MSSPLSPKLGVVFDFAAIGRELVETAPFINEGQSARTLIRTPDLRIVVVALKQGKTISEHQAQVTASVQTLSGEIRVQLPDRSVTVTSGQLLVMKAGLSHDVYAQFDSVFVLTLGWPTNTGP